MRKSSEISSLFYLLFTTFWLPEAWGPTNSSPRVMYLLKSTRTQKILGVGDSFFRNLGSGSGSQFLWLKVPLPSTAFTTETLLGANQVKLTAFLTTLISPSPLYPQLSNTLLKNLTYTPHNTSLHTCLTIWRQFCADKFRFESLKAELSRRLASRLKTPLRFGFRTKDPYGKCAKKC